MSSSKKHIKKAVDDRLGELIDRGVDRNERSVIVMVGANAKSRVPSIHEMLAKSCHKRPSVLWCYKRELGIVSSHRKKRARLLKKAAARGITLDDDSLEQFVAHTHVRWCYYRDTASILGTTFGTLVLQDFDAVTPNILAQTVETIEGGGLIILLMGALTSVESLYKAAGGGGNNDTESRRFMQRVLLLLLKDAAQPNCIFVDDELNVLDFFHQSANAFKKETVVCPEKKETPFIDTGVTTSLEKKLRAKCKTPDQAYALSEMIKYLTTTASSRVLALTSARGRGKSATLGLALAAAFDLGYGSMCLVAPSAESVVQIFNFVVIGLEALEYIQNVHFLIMHSGGHQSCNDQESGPSSFSRSQHRGGGQLTICIKMIKNKNGAKRGQQQLRYLWPDEARYAFGGRRDKTIKTYSKQSILTPTTDLLILDEAAAMPLPFVKQLLGPYPTLLSSTVDGYEGTGRALQLKLLSEIKKEADDSMIDTEISGKNGIEDKVKEIKLVSPIRYASGDPVERWLNIALCLDYHGNYTSLQASLPPPSDCSLYQVNRHVLFSLHPTAEEVLHRMVNILSLAHYRSSPNDIEKMADEPAHRIFVLLAPVQKGQAIPDILAVVHLAFEGCINTTADNKEGDLIPWTLSQQFCESAFPKLAGVRILRIVTHPEARAMGYGSRTLHLLIDYFQRSTTSHVQQQSTASLFVPISQLSLCDNGPIWIGASFGGTLQLLNFWSRAQFRPVYLRQTASELTGEHTAILLRCLKGDHDWLDSFVQDARRRFIALSSSPCFREIELGFALAYLGHADSDQHVDNTIIDEHEQLTNLRNHSGISALANFSDRDLIRLEMYARNAIDHRVIADLAPLTATLVFTSRLQVRLSSLQAAVLFGFALQRRDVDDLSNTLNIPSNQVLALYNKAMRKISQCLQRMQKEEEGRDSTQTGVAVDLPDENAASSLSIRLTSSN